MKKYLSVFCITFFVTSLSSQNCSDLFISEYVEGSGNNKALEIYNPTSIAVDLSSYIIIRYSNGATSASSAYAIQLVGTILPNDVNVGVLEKLNPAGTGQELPVADSLQAKADEFYCPVYAINSTWYWNGNDAIVLARGSVNEISDAIIVDVFGKIGEDPGSGWIPDSSLSCVGSQYSWTEDHTLIRKSTVLSGNINSVPVYFNPSLEWDSIPEDSWGNLGSHTCDCASSTSINENNESSYFLYPNPVNKGELVSISSNDNVRKIIVTNILGETVNFVNSINTRDLVKGIYIVGIEFVNGKVATNKLIIKD